MLVAEERSIRDYPAPRRIEAPIQLIQGCYWIVVGCWVAVAISSFQSSSHPTLDLSHMWIARLVGAVAALAGVGLIIASRQTRSIYLASGIAIGLAVFILVLEVVAMVMRLLPTTFLLDSGVEIGFLMWWAFAMYPIIRR